MAALKNCPVIVYIEEALEEVLQAECRRTGSSASNYLRSILLSHLVQANKVPTELLVLIAGGVVREPVAKP